MKDHNLNRIFSILVSALLATTLYSQGSMSWSMWSEIGLQNATSLESAKCTRNLGYVSLGGQARFDAADLELGTRIQGDSIARSTKMQILAGFVSTNYRNVQLRIGWQKIAWGETFGFYIADLVNPRDYSDLWINDIQWMRLAVGAIQAKWLADKASIELVLTPFPRRNILPSASNLVSGQSPVKLQVQGCSSKVKSIKAIEGGTKFGYLTDLGTDFSLFVYRHWNRNAAYQLDINGYQYWLNPIQRLTTSVGLCASHALPNLVCRMDSVLHLGQPWPSLTYGKIQSQNIWESVVGIDYVFENGASAALQGHYDYWSWNERFGLSIRLASREKPKGIYGELFGFWGLGKNQDRWLQPRLVWNLSSTWQAKLQLNFLSGHADPWKPQTGNIYPAYAKNSFLVWISARL